MRIACWITKATNTHTHTEHVTLIVSPLQQWLYERTLVLHCTQSTLPVSLFHDMAFRPPGLEVVTMPKTVTCW